MTPILAAIVLSQAAVQPPPCALAPFLANVLMQVKERVVVDETDAANRRVQLWISEGWATWTLTVTERTGVMCIVSSGKGRPPPPGLPS
jgi:hypothetical protein